MASIILILTLFISARCLIVKAASKCSYKLELVQVLFRHGDRTPEKVEIYPTDPYNSSVYEPYGYGQLTNAGKRREYEIGQVLRKLYGKFLGDTYRPADVYAYSSDYDRTKMSLQLVLASLYPPDRLLTWNESVNWMPIPAHYNRRKLDFMMTSLACSEYQELLRKASKSPELRTKFSAYENTYNYIMNKTGLTTNEYMTILLVYNVIQSHQSLGLPSPSWLSKTLYDELKEMAALAYETFSLTNPMITIGVGPVLKRFIDNINNQETKMNSRKIYLYSAHDINISLFTKAHGLTIPRIPEYGTAVILEKFRECNDRIYIRLLVWTGAGRQLIPLKLKDSEELCPWLKYLEILKPVLPQGSGTECLLRRLSDGIVQDIVNGGETKMKILPSPRYETICSEVEKEDVQFQGSTTLKRLLLKQLAASFLFTKISNQIHSIHSKLLIQIMLIFRSNILKCLIE